MVWAPNLPHFQDDKSVSSGDSSVTQKLMQQATSLEPAEKEILFKTCLFFSILPALLFSYLNLGCCWHTRGVSELRSSAGAFSICSSAQTSSSIFNLSSYTTCIFCPNWESSTYLSTQRLGRKILRHLSSQELILALIRTKRKWTECLPRLQDPRSLRCLLL